MEHPALEMYNMEQSMLYLARMELKGWILELRAPEHQQLGTWLTPTPGFMLIPWPKIHHTKLYSIYDFLWQQIGAVKNVITDRVPHFIDKQWQIKDISNPIEAFIYQNENF